MQNISVFNTSHGSATIWVLSLMVLVFAPSVFAEAEHVPVYQSQPEVNITESSKPVFDLDLFKDKPAKVEPFFKELQEDMNDFSADQRKRRVKFLKNVRKKEMDSEERQDKIIKFNREEREKLEKFHGKQRKKIKKYHEKKGLL